MAAAPPDAATARLLAACDAVWPKNSGDPADALKNTIAKEIIAGGRMIDTRRTVRTPQGITLDFTAVGEEMGFWRGGGEGSVGVGVGDGASAACRRSRPFLLPPLLLPALPKRAAACVIHIPTRYKHNTLHHTHHTHHAPTLPFNKRPSRRALHQDHRRADPVRARRLRLGLDLPDLPGPREAQQHQVRAADDAAARRRRHARRRRRGRRRERRGGGGARPAGRRRRRRRRRRRARLARQRGRRQRQAPGRRRVAAPQQRAGQLARQLPPGQVAQVARRRRAPQELLPRSVRALRVQGPRNGGVPRARLRPLPRARPHRRRVRAGVPQVRPRRRRRRRRRARRAQPPPRARVPVPQVPRLPARRPLHV